MEVEAVLNSRLVQGNLRVQLVDLGFGGFAVDCPIIFRVGVQQTFKFTMSTGVSVLLCAEAVYSRPSGSDAGMDHYVSGFKYVLATPRDERAVDILIDAANSPLTFL